MKLQQDSPVEINLYYCKNRYYSPISVLDFLTTLPSTIVFVIELIIVIIYTPIVFTLYFILDYKKIMELTSAILGLSLFFIEDITAMVITLYDEILYRRRKKYFNAIQKMCDIEEQRAK